MVIINQHGEILLANAQMETLFGYSSQELIGQPIEMLVPERYRSRHPHHRANFFASPQSRMMGAGRDLFGQRKDGREIPVEIGLNPINTDAGLLVLASVIDITQRKHAEEQLKSTLDQLQGLAIHMETVREEERTRIAREVHDELGQALTGLKLELAWIKGRLIKENRQEQLPLLLDKAEEMSKQIDTTIQSMRRIVTELRPGILDEFGLAAALEWQGQEFHKRTGIPCSVSVTETSVNAERSSALFRIVQEALTNIARHANATSVEIRLQQDNAGLSLTIEDNGIGITDEMIVSGRSFGLLGMRERAAAIGGSFELGCPRGAGTKIAVHIPSSLKVEKFPMINPECPVEALS
jgi:PAS domain S-box-containing protein